MAVVRDLQTVNAELQEQKERVENVDFKMITFSLAGKDYGVDIMNVKEIAKADKLPMSPMPLPMSGGSTTSGGILSPSSIFAVFFTCRWKKPETAWKIC